MLCCRFRRQTDWTLAWEFILLGARLARRGRAEIGTRLIGASESLRERVGLTLTGTEADLYKETEERLQRVLGEERYEFVRVEGLSMSVDDAVELARSAVVAQ